MSNQYLKVENEKALVRDSYSKAILNTDVSSVKRHEERMRRIEKQKSQEREINSLRQEIAEIRELLCKMISK